MKPYFKTLSHVGVPTSDLERSLRWYVDVLGLREAFRLHGPEGDLRIIYLHLTPTTFLEILAPKAGQDKPPHTHFAIEVEGIEQAVEDLKSRLPAESIKRPEIITGRDGSSIFNFFDPDGHRIEFMEFGPEAQQYKAMRRLESGE